MKTIKTLFTITTLILSCTLLNLACKKNSDTKIEVPAKPDEHPITLFYEEGGFNANVYNFSGTNNIESGFTFKPLTNGILKAISIKLPFNLNQNRITLWDKATGAILFTWRVPKLTDTSPKNECIITLETPYALTQNKEYILSMNANNFYLHTLASGLKANYPITINSIQFLSFLQSEGFTTNQELPTLIITDYVFGDFGFTFQPL